MPMNQDNKNKNYIRWGVTAFLVILASMIAYYIIFNLDNFKGTIDKVWVILMPVTDGLILAYLLTPLLNVIERKIVKPFFAFIKCEAKHKQMRLVSILLTIILVGSITYGFFAMVIPQIVNSIRTIIMQFPSYVDTLTYWISKLLEDNPDIENFANEMISKYSTEFEDIINAKVLPQLNNIIVMVSTGVYSFLKESWNFIIGFIISIYVLASKELFAAQFKKITYAFIPLEAANRFVSNVRFSNKTFGGFFVGKILDSIIIGILCFVCTSIIGTPFNVLISVIVGVTNIVPFFGPFLGAVPSLMLILFIDPVQALYFLVFVFLLQQVDGNIIGPKILGNSTGLSSFWVIFAITLFGGLFGIAGMILGVPIFAVIFAFMKSTVESRLNLKNLPPETSNYLKLLYIEADTKKMVTFSEKDKKPFSEITRILVKSHEHIKQQEIEWHSLYKIISHDTKKDDATQNTDTDETNSDTKK